MLPQNNEMQPRHERILLVLILGELMLIVLGAAVEFSLKGLIYFSGLGSKFRSLGSMRASV